MRPPPALVSDRLRGLAGAAPQPAPAPVVPLESRQLSIAVEGPHDTSFSLAIVNRAFTDALARQPGVSSYAGLPVDGTTHAVRNMYPPRLDNVVPGVRTLFYFAWEDSRIPSAWADAFNRHFDGLLVPSAHVRDVVERSGVAIPVAVVPYGVAAPGTYDERRRPADSPLTRKRFRFLHVSTGFPRKGCDVLLRAYAREFSSRDDVALVVKTLPQYDHVTARLVRRARWLHLRCPEIVHVDDDLDSSALQGLYASASCLVHPARAEGFGLPIAEAMLAGVPVIVSAYSGHTDFCTEATSMLVPCRLVRSRSPFVVADAEWGEPDEAALRRAMRYVFEHREDSAVRQRVQRASTHIQTFTWSRAAMRAVDFMRALDASEQTHLRVGMLTTWQEACGIAEYSRQLIAAVRDPSIAWTILAPDRNDSSEAAATLNGAAVPVARCWRDRWPIDLTEAVAHVRRLDLHVLHIQTHLNVWSTRSVAALSEVSTEGRRVFMTLHSVRGARPEPGVVQALSQLDRIFVHTNRDRVLLLAMGLDRNVTVLPQGYPMPADEPAEAVRARLGIRGGPVIGTFGFLRPHKGVIELIRAIGSLRRRYPDVALLAATALYRSADSSDYHERCLLEAQRQGLAERCWFVTDFLEPSACIAALQACDVVALPYHSTADSSSAAVRVALAARRPVVTSAAPVFAEVADAVLTLRSIRPRPLARGIFRALEDRELRTRLGTAAATRLTDQSWDVVGRTYRKVLRGAATDFSGFRAPYPVAPSS